MLKEILYEMLMKATRFVCGIWILDDLFNIGGYAIGRVILTITNAIGKVLNVCLWLGGQLFLISITGGMYLAWLVLRKMWKRNKNKRRNNHHRRRA